MFGKQTIVVVDGEAYTIIGKKPIAEGATAAIYKCKRQKTKGAFALKKMTTVDDEQSLLVEKEIKTLLTLNGVNHPNIIQLVGHDSTVDSDANHYLIYPLYDVTLDLREIDTPDIELIFSQILDGLKFILLSGYRHNDIKPQNILINNNSKIPVITDFGSTTAATVVISSRKDALHYIDFHARNTTATYRAPELWDIPSETILSPLADAFSAGALLFALVFGKTAFEYNVGKVRLPDASLYSSDSVLIKIMLGLLVVDVDKRMSVDDAINSIANGDISEVQKAKNAEYYKVNIEAEVDTSIEDFADFDEVEEGFLLR